MSRAMSRWGTTAIGAVLTLWGLGSMWTGWEQVQIERGWSLFLGGSTAVAGGVVTMALGVAIGRLDQLIRALQSSRAPARADEAGTSAGVGLSVEAKPSSNGPSGAKPVSKFWTPSRRATGSQAAISSILSPRAPKRSAAPEPVVAEAKAETPASASAQSDPLPFKEEPRPSTPAAAAPQTAEAVEVDRYVSGDTIYVMYSDGGVEVRTPAGAQRYASLDHLRAEAATRQS